MNALTALFNLPGEAWFMLAVLAVLLLGSGALWGARSIEHLQDEVKRLKDIADHQREFIDSQEKRPVPQSMQNIIQAEFIEKIAKRHESFGFGSTEEYNGVALTTHGFDPEGLDNFVREIAYWILQWTKEPSTIENRLAENALIAIPMEGNGAVPGWYIDGPGFFLDIEFDTEAQNFTFFIRNKASGHEKYVIQSGDVTTRLEKLGLDQPEMGKPDTTDWWYNARRQPTHPQFIYGFKAGNATSMARLNHRLEAALQTTTHEGLLHAVEKIHKSTKKMQEYQDDAYPAA